MNRKTLSIILTLAAAVLLLVLLTVSFRQLTLRTEPQKEAQGHLETISYRIRWAGNSYEKNAVIYVPASYDAAKPMNILYLMHGSGGSGEQLAEAMEPLFDDWMQTGRMRPALVVFPTYYPDRSYVTADYSADYPLNHFFAAKELHRLIQAAEKNFHTYADSISEADLRRSRRHRAFGGYSMGGVTTWDVLAYQSRYFSCFLPMAGDCWLNRATKAASTADAAALLVRRLKEDGCRAEDIRIVAMVGGSDATRYSIRPQIRALRRSAPELFTDDNLLYWENEGGGHNQTSLEQEVAHGACYLWTLR